MDTPFSPRQRVSLAFHALHSWFANQFDDQKQKQKGAIESLDGVRALAILIVLSFHLCIMTSQLHLWNQQRQPFLNALTSAGGSGVTLFFVLSGFLLFLPYSQALLFQKRWPEAKIFYVRRILRIFPLYYFSLFLFVMFHNAYLLSPHNWTHVLPFLTFTMNFSDSQLIDGPYWTLAVEFQYYLLLPLIALGMYGLSRLVRPERRFWMVVGSLLAMVAWGLLTHRWGDYFSNHPQATFLVSRSILNSLLFLFYGQNGKFLEDFAVGMLIAVWYVQVTTLPQKEKQLRLLQRFSPWFALCWLVLYTFASMRNLSIVGGHVWSVVPYLFQIFPWTNELIFAISYSCCLLAVLFNRPEGLLRRLFAWTPLRWIGLLSFGLYIWHVPFLQIIQKNLGPSLSHVNRFVAIGLCVGVVFGVSVSFSFITYVLIEKPGLRLSSRLRQQLLKQGAKTQIATSLIDTLPSEKRVEQKVSFQEVSPIPLR